MKNFTKLLFFSVLFFVLNSKFGNTALGNSLPANEGNLDCEIVVIGGGPGGLHTAFRLGSRYGSKVCLFEKEARLGGRIYDISKEEKTNGPYIAVGARRIMQGQKLVFSLAKELGLKLEKPDLDADLMFTRGIYSTNKNDFVKAYPGIKYEHGNDDAETQFVTKLLQSPERSHIDKYSSLKSYIKAVVGQEGFEYLRDVSRFRGDFEYPLSAKAYLEYLDEEINVCCQPSYPKGGMSAFIRGMEQKARSSGVRIFMSEPILSIDKDGSGYKIISSKHEITARSVVAAVPPQSFEHIAGSIAKQIRKQPQFKALIGIPVVTITQWFDKPWWKSIHTTDNKEVWRAWTTGSCINFVEIPQEDYVASQNAIRSVYCDERDCVKKWEKWAKEGPQKLAFEVHKGLVQIFEKNGVTTPIHVPEATKTVFHVWPDAWYYVRAGTSFSSKDISDWAIEPLKGESIGMVSEGYNPQRSTWSDAAYKSSNNLLSKKYGMKAIESY